MIYDYFAGVDADGWVRCSRRQAVPNEGPSLPPDGLTYHPIDGPINWSAQPSRTNLLAWNGGDMEWIETATVDEAHANAWAAVKQARDAAEAAPFEFEGGMYDPNKENVSGAALAALLAQLGGVEVSRTWTLADNSRRVLTGAQIIAMGLALTTRVDAIHERGRLLRDRLETLKKTPGTTPEQLYAVTWDEETTNV